MQSDGIHRRTLFRGATLGLGGLYLAPFLRDLAADASLPRPPRVLFFVQGNGVYPADIQPDGIERQDKPDQLEDIPLAGHAMSTSLQPLEPWTSAGSWSPGSLKERNGVVPAPGRHRRGPTREKTYGRNRLGSEGVTLIRTGILL